MAIPDNTIVRVLSRETEVWRGTVAEFERINAFDDHAAAVLRTDLHLHGKFDSGDTVIELVSAGWIVTAITRNGREVCRYESGESAQVAAFVALASRAMVTIVGPDGEYRSVVAAMTPNRPAIHPTV